MRDEVFLFHYTNPAGSRGILRDREIRVTNAGSRFAWFGQGVYMTAVPPSAGRNQILYNNHHKTHTLDANLWAKTSIYFKISSKFLPEAKKMDDRYNRDIYVHPQNIDLDRVPFQTGLSDNYEVEFEEQEPKIDVISHRNQLPVSNRDSSYTWPVPQTYISVPQTNISIPKTNTSVPQTYTPVPQTYTPVPQTYTPVPQTNVSVPREYFNDYHYADNERRDVVIRMGNAPRRKKRSCCDFCNIL